MAISSILFAAFGLLTLAQGAGNPLDGLPKCAQSCATSILSSSACGSTNGACICSNGPVLESLSCCLLANCNASETEQAVQFAGNICRLFNAPNVPTKAVCSTSSASSTASSSSTMSPPVFGQPAGTGRVLPLPSSSSTMMAPSESAMSASMSPSAAVTSGTGAGASASSSAPAASSTGAASQMGPAMGLAGVVVGGLAVLL